MLDRSALSVGLTMGLAASTLVTVAGTAESEETAQAAGRPNIVFIMTDDQDTLLMDYMPQTQALLVDQGVTFENGLVDLPLCCPARATTLLGQGAKKHGIYTNRSPGGYAPFVPLEDETIAVWMDRVGYDTAFFGKYINGYPSHTPSLKAQNHIPVGWDRWFGLWSNEQDPHSYSVNDDGVIRSGLGYNTDVMAAEAVEFIEDSDHDPFMMMIFDTAPHTPLVPAPRHENLYSGLTLPRSPNFNEADVSDKTYYRNQPPVPRASIEAYDNEFRLRVLEMQAVDDMVGDIVAALDEAGKLDDTYIVFTSDNGYLIGNHRLHGKVFPYEEAINVPIVVRGPGIAPGTVSDELVGNIDFAPTFAALGGAEVTIDVDGANFMGLVSSDVPTPLLWREVFRVNAAFFDIARTKDDVLIEFADGSREYYDLRVDPFQLDNTYSTMDPVRRAALESALFAFMASNAAPQVTAGDDQVVTGRTTTLVGHVADDGLPWATDLLVLPPTRETLAIEWAQTSGPAAAEFVDRTDPSTTVTFPRAGVYQFTLTADDSTGPVSDLMTVFVHDPQLRIGLIAGRTQLSGPDQVMRDIMLGEGFLVTVVDDDTDFENFDLAELDVLAISSSVQPNKVGTAFTHANIPILTWENYLFGDLGLGSEQTTQASQTRLRLLDPDHPLAANLSGSPAVFFSPSELSWGTVGADADAVASVDGEPSRVVIASYQTGDRLTDGSTAPAARVALFPDYAAPGRLNTNGRRLVAAALHWLGSHADVAEPQPPRNRAPVVDVGPDRTVELPTSHLGLSTTVDDDALPAGAEVRIAWRQVSGPPGVEFESVDAPETIVTFPGAGEYVLELSADDSELVGTDSVRVTVREPSRDALLVAGTTNLPSGDRPIRDLILDAGLDITIVDDDTDLAAIDTSGFDLIVITSSVVPSKVGDVFAATPVPIVTWESYLFDDLQLASSETSTSTHTTITISDPAHPLAAGASGTVTVYTTPSQLSWGIPAASADVVAHVPGRPDQPVVIAYETGDQLLNGSPAPAPRVGLFPDYLGGAKLTTSGAELIAAAIDLVVGDLGDEPLPPTNRPPTVEAGANRSVSLPEQTALLDGTISDDGLPEGVVLTTTWTQTGGPPGVTFADPAAVDTVATFPSVGEYELTLTALDTEFSASDTVVITVRDAGVTAVMIAGTTTPPSGDRLIRDRLIAADIDVSIVDDDSDLTQLDLSAVDLLVISSSVDPRKVGDAFTTTPIPLITWENYLFDDLALATPRVTTTRHTSIAISEPTHRLAAGLTGSPRVFDRPNFLSWGTPSSDAHVIAHVPGNPNQPVLISYATGDRLVNGTASPAPRIALFADYVGAGQLSSGGIALVDAAIELLT